MDRFHHSAIRGLRLGVLSMGPALVLSCAPNDTPEVISSHLELAPVSTRPDLTATSPPPPDFSGAPPKVRELVHAPATWLLG